MGFQSNLAPHTHSENPLHIGNRGLFYTFYKNLGKQKTCSIGLAF
jgi:hypothetical protein